MIPTTPSRPPGERGRGTIRPPTSLLVALLLSGVALAGAVLWLGLDPRDGAPRLQGPVDIWLLASFVLGMLLLLFGASASLGVSIRSSGAREGLEALRARAEALEARLETDGATPGRAEAPRAEAPHAAPKSGTGAAREADGGAGRGIMATGGWLLLLYAVGWLATG